MDHELGWPGQFSGAALPYDSKPGRDFFSTQPAMGQLLLSGQRPGAVVVAGAGVGTKPAGAVAGAVLSSVAGAGARNAWVRLRLVAPDSARIGADALPDQIYRALRSDSAVAGRLRRARLAARQGQIFPPAGRRRRAAVPGAHAGQPLASFAR